MENFITFKLPVIENATSMFEGTNVQNFSGSSNFYIRINPACKNITSIFKNLQGPIGDLLLEDSNAGTLYFTNVIKADYAFDCEYPR